jgi:predicted SAM-dependent methyltransferase
MKTKYLLKGIVKSIPGIEYIYNFHKNTGGSCNARYCYVVWLTHLSYAFQNGTTEIPKYVVELGPGDSLGTGLASLITGAEKYYALDIVRYTNAEESLKIFDELVLLFKNKSPIPSQAEFPLIRPLLNNYDFPHYLLDENKLQYLLSDERINSIRNAIKKIEIVNEQDTDEMISFIVPWLGNNLIENNSIDMIFSQAVLQHIDQLELTYNYMYQWLKPNGIISHEIDFKSMGSADTWDGHWAYSDIEWMIVKGRKLFYINREGYSTHKQLLQNNQFEVLFESKSYEPPTLHKNKIAKRFKSLSEDDLQTTNTFFQATKLV